MAFLNINFIKENLVNASNIDNLINENINEGKKQHEIAKQLMLSPLIRNPNDVIGFEWPETQPNFITQNSIISNVVMPDKNLKLENSIVCIPNADPGFDWLFSHSIGAIITAWGGANSHMAIRAAELGMPAVIGAGEINYKKWSTANTLQIDCANQSVKVIN